MGWSGIGLGLVSEWSRNGLGLVEDWSGYGLWVRWGCLGVVRLRGWRLGWPVGVVREWSGIGLGMV